MSYQTFYVHHFEYHDRVTTWLEEYYVANSSTNKSLIFYLFLSMNENVDECTFVKGFKGLHNYHYHSMLSNRIAA